jgi:menaquinol-cytochrome c reductase cytochrome b/c subunit
MKMNESKDFVAGMESDFRKAPVRVAFVTRRTSPAVKFRDEDYVMTFPETLLRAAVAIEVLVLSLVWVALLWNAPLEQLADPMHTPNPAKAPWYFLGLQELLHYFPPVVAGVLVPGLVVMALIVIPYFNINVEAEGIFTKDRRLRIRIASVAVVLLLVFLLVFDVYVAVPATVLIGVLLAIAAMTDPALSTGFRRWLVSKPVSFWIMTWFLMELVVLTAVGTFFRGPGWSWVWPWRS